MINRKPKKEQKQDSNLSRGKRRRMKKSLTIGTILMITLFMGSYLFAQEKEEVIGKATKFYSDGSLQEITYYVNGKEVAREIWNKEGEVTEVIGKIPDGLVKYHENDRQAEAEFNFKNNKRNGLFKIYYDNGRLKFEGNYKDNRPDGIIKEYSKNGNLLSEENYKNGKLDGFSNWYGEDGKLKTAEFYSPDGKLESHTYYKSGRLERIESYKNGKLEGITCEYYDKDDFSSSVRAIANYKDGKLDGLNKLYRENGKLFLEIMFRNGELNGEVKTYYENGVLSLEINYKNDKQNGIGRSYTENGMLGEESNWKDGKQDGITKTYWQNSDIIAYIDTYKNGEKINRKAYGREGKLEFDQDYPYIEKEGKVK